MSILSDVEVKIRSIRPDLILFFGTEEEKHDVKFFNRNPEETIEDFLASYKGQVAQYNLTKSTAFATLEEFLEQYPEGLVREEAKKNFAKDFASVRLVTEDEDLSMYWRPMIDPYVSTSVNTNEEGNKIPSYGQGPYSYDIRMGRNFKMFKTKESFKQFQETQDLCYCGPEFDLSGILIDTAAKNPTEGLMKDFNDVDYIDIPPYGFALGHALERLVIPRDVLATCMAKSSIARMGLIAHVTPAEPEWEGYLTIELSNTTPFTIRVWAGIGIMALIFQQANITCQTSYADRGGKYQGQEALPIETIN